MLKYIVILSFILLLYVAVYGTICMFKQISRLKDKQEDDLYDYGRSKATKLKEVTENDIT